MKTNKQDRKVRKALKKYGKGLEASRKGNEKKADRMQAKGAKKARKAGMSMPRLEEFEKRGYNLNPKSGRVYGGGGKMKYKKGGKFPDLTGDGKVTMADVLEGRGVGMKKPSRSEKRQMRKQDRITKRGQKRFEKESKRRARRGN